MAYVIYIKATGKCLGADGKTYVEDEYFAYDADTREEAKEFGDLNGCDWDYCEIVEWEA